MDRSELIQALDSIKENISTLAQMPEFLSLHCCKEETSLHISVNGFKNIFSPNNVSFKRCFWDERNGFKYEVSVQIAGIKVFCFTKESELEEYLGVSTQAIQAKKGIAV